MNDINIPDGLPTLARGAHDPGDGKACVMEYVALLAGEEWSDHPTCTHPVLARVAQVVNDTLPDNLRYLLVPMIGRLFGTGRTLTWTGRPADSEADRELTWSLLRHLDSNMHLSVEQSLHMHSPNNFAQGSANYAGQVVHDRMMKLGPHFGLYSLRDLIDTYDRLTGRTEHREVTAAELADLKAKVTV